MDPISIVLVIGGVLMMARGAKKAPPPTMFQPLPEPMPTQPTQPPPASTTAPRQTTRPVVGEGAITNRIIVGIDGAAFDPEPAPAPPPVRRAPPPEPRSYGGDQYSRFEQ